MASNSPYCKRVPLEATMYKTVSCVWNSETISSTFLLTSIMREINKLNKKDGIQEVLHFLLQEGWGIVLLHVDMRAFCNYTMMIDWIFVSKFLWILIAIIATVKAKGLVIGTTKGNFLWMMSSSWKNLPSVVTHLYSCHFWVMVSSIVKNFPNTCNQEFINREYATP